MRQFTHHLRKGLILLGLLVAGPGWAATPALPCGAGACQVGFKVITVNVSGATVNVAVWYPTDTPAAATTYGTSRIAGNAAVDAPVKRGKWPLIVFGHGYSGSGVGSARLAEIAASYGWVFAAPDFTDAVVTTRIAGTPTGTFEDALKQLTAEPPSVSSYSYRMDQLRATVDSMVGKLEFKVDPARIVLAGHSLGAWTAVNVALNDTRVKALVLYSMGELNYLYKKQRIFPADVLGRLTVPVAYYYGSREKEAVADAGEPNAAFAYASTRSRACIAEVRGGNHFVYVNREVAPASGGTPLQLQRIGEATMSFLGNFVLGLNNTVIANACK